MMVRVSNRKWIGWAAERPRFRSGYGVSTARRQPLYVPPVRDARSPTDPTQVVATCTASCRPLPSPRARYAPFSGPRRDRDGNLLVAFPATMVLRVASNRDRERGKRSSEDDPRARFRATRRATFGVSVETSSTSRESLEETSSFASGALASDRRFAEKSAAADFSSSTRFRRRPSRAPRCPRASPASRLPAVSPSRFAPMPRTSPST